ncbi:MAG: sugar ABC transporter ATP-binding protein [Fimbriimonas sp.]
MTTRLAVDSVTKRYPGVVALRGVSLSLGEGEVVGLIGENGAGKSTLMKILGGLVQPDEGTVTFEGQAVRIGSPVEAAGLGIGFIHQELSDLDNLDIAGNISLGQEPTRGPLRLLDRAAMDETASRAMALLGLNLSPRALVSSLSLAQRQMIEIAKALSREAKVLIMDEPTSSLTLTETDRLLQVVKDLRARGVSVIYISHRLGEIEQIADRVVALRDGQNAGELLRGEINRSRMVPLMVGRELIAGSHESQATADVVLDVRDLRTLRYPGQSVSFQIHAGEVVGLAGLVGSGRSEIARALFGVDAVVGGTVSVRGQSLQLGSPASAIAAGLFLAPEDRRGTGLVTTMKIRENITLANLPRFASAGLIRKDDEARYADTQSVHLGVKAPNTEFTVSNLSGGNQQKVVLAKWLGMNPRVMIFDEPTRGIDVGAKAEIYAQMRVLAASGVAVLAISSEMEEVLAVSDRVLVMREGRLTGALPRAEASERTIMELAV